MSQRPPRPVQEPPSNENSWMYRMARGPFRGQSGLDPVGPDYRVPGSGPFAWGLQEATRPNRTVNQRLQLFNLSTNPRYREGFAEGASTMPQSAQLYQGIWTYYDRYGATPSEQSHLQGTSAMRWHTEWESEPFLRPAPLQSWNWYQNGNAAWRSELEENYNEYTRRYNANPSANRARQQMAAEAAIRENTLEEPPGGPDVYREIDEIMLEEMTDDPMTVPQSQPRLTNSDPIYG